MRAVISISTLVSTLASIVALSACGVDVPNRGAPPVPAQPAAPANAEPEAPPSPVGAPAFTPDRDAPPIPDADASLRPGMPIVTGPIDVERVRAGIHERYAELLGCYTAALPSAPELEGLVIIEFSIDARGGVRDAEARYDVGVGLEQPRVSACMARGVSRWSFDAPSEAGNSEVSLAFEVQPG